MRHANEQYTAHDAATGDVLWEYVRSLPTEITSAGVEVRGRFGFTMHRGRGVFLYEDKFAVPYNCTATSAPDPCHLSAYDADTGALVWRWHTSPTQDDPGHRTWGEDPQRYPLESRRNRSPWMTSAVDIERGLFIFGVGSSAPQQPELAGTDGEWPDRLFQGSTVALGVNPDIRPGEARQLVVGSFAKDGIFYAYDRNDGTFLYARPTGYQSVIQSYDGTTGAYTTNPDAVMTAGSVILLDTASSQRQ